MKTIYLFSLIFALVGFTACQSAVKNETGKIRSRDQASFRHGSQTSGRKTGRAVYRRSHAGRI